MSHPLGPYLRERVTGAYRVLMFRCPGCGITHDVYLQRGDAGPVHRWDGSILFPSLDRAVLTHVTLPHGPEVTDEAAPKAVCEVSLRDGMLTYSLGCTHDMAGKRLSLPKFAHAEELPPLPDPRRMFARGVRGKAPWRPA